MKNKYFIALVSAVFMGFILGCGDFGNTMAGVERSIRDTRAKRHGAPGSSVRNSCKRECINRTSNVVYCTNAINDMVEGRANSNHVMRNICPNTYSRY